VTYDVSIRRYTEVQGTSVVIGSGSVLVDGEEIYKITDAKVGVFPDIQYDCYPFDSENAVGGVMKNER